MRQLLIKMCRTIIQKAKNFFKKFLPPPVNAFNREITRVLSAINTQKVLIETQNEGYVQLLEAVNNLVASLNVANARIEEIDNRLNTTIDEISRLSSAQQCGFDALQVEFTEKNRILLDGIEATQKQLADINDETKTYISQTSTLITEKVMYEVQKPLAELQKNSTTVLMDHIDKAEQKNTASQKTMLAEIDKSRYWAYEAKKHSSEAVWAAVFNNAITGSSWLNNKTFYPGRWAAGYPALYVMYRVLNEFKPKHILELGMGQSTHMINQYVTANKGVEHYVVEHNPEWIEFFKKTYGLSDETQVVQLEREFAQYKEADSVRVFKDFRSTFSAKEFDFIFVDAPLGGDMKTYSRIDVLSIIPECLTDNFVIMVDDADRSGEKNTIKEICQVLDCSEIEYSMGTYSGAKNVVMICDKDSSFLTTM